jgi:DNA-binding transcriptional MocR family regulator
MPWLEDPCFLASLNTVRLGGYRPIAVPVDDEGMTVAGLQAALDAGVRAVLLTPRAQNPTGASLSAERAAALRALLADHPYVLVIEDDHFSMLSAQPFPPVISASHRRWAHPVRLEVPGARHVSRRGRLDPDTAERLAERLNPGATWVSHLLQRVALEQLTDPDAVAAVAAASAHYAARNRAAAAAFTAAGVPVVAGDGLSLWVPLPVPARAASSSSCVADGSCVRATSSCSKRARRRHLRITVHDLSDADLARLATDLAAAIPAAAATSKAG